MNQPDFSFLTPLKTTEVFTAYWRFAAERQRILFARFAGEPAPWTLDAVLQRYKFTNVFRACDRVSQYDIRHVIYGPDYQGASEPDEVFFRVVVFKMFNSVQTWEFLCSELEDHGVSARNYSYEEYDAVLTAALTLGQKIWSAAYIMNQLYREDLKYKHQRYLKLLELMMADRLPDKLAAATSYQQAIWYLRQYPMLGGSGFIAAQWACDLNYSPLLNFDENDFVVVGPGARDGIAKCFSHRGNLTDEQIIRLVTEHQTECASAVGIEPITLYGRPMKLIDVQNVFCEIDKFARIAFPEFNLGRTSIKQTLKPKPGPLPPLWLPPKWGLNEEIAKGRQAAATV